jgi:hypothetical protein
MHVYPNPAKDKIICRISNSNITLVAAQLFDMLGETMAISASRAADNSLVLSLTDIVNGMYVIQAMDSHGQLYQSKISIFK